MKYLMLLLVVLLALLTACDNRDTDAPEMTITVSTTELYNEGNGQNYADILIDLDGDNASTDSVRINIEYDSAQGTFNPDSDYPGSASFIRTNSQGIAAATFTVKDSAFGDVPVTFTLDTYQSVNETIHFNVIDIPEIEITSAEDSLVADGATMMDVYVQLTSNSENIEGLWIDFTSDLITSADSIQTDTEGRATIQVQAPEDAAVYYVTGRIRDFDKLATVYIRCY